MKPQNIPVTLNHIFKIQPKLFIHFTHICTHYSTTVKLKLRMRKQKQYRKSFDILCYRRRKIVPTIEVNVWLINYKRDWMDGHRTCVIN